MTTAHELARKLLAGPDYEIVLGDDVTEYACPAFDVVSLSATRAGETVTFPVVGLIMPRDQQLVEVSSYSRG